MPELLYIVDTFSLLFQVFHAIPQMTSPQGQPTNAVFGFTRDLKMIRDNVKPTHLICAMDSPGPGVRNEWYADYKANREEMPEDLRPQIEMVVSVIDGFRVPVVSCDGWEADDVFATLARKAVDDGFEVRIVTTDKDARQLLGPRVQLYNVRKDLFIDEAYLQQDWGIRAEQAIDFQALVGDSVDNVPGVPLVGPKKAQALLENFDTLEGVLAHADEAPGKKLRENLKQFADQARLSRRLVELNRELPLEIDWDSARVQEPDRARLLELFTDFGFGRFAEEMRSSTGNEPAASSQQRTWETIDTKAAFNKFVKALAEQSSYCVDLETTSLKATQADIVGWAFCWEARKAFYIPVDGPPDQQTLDSNTVLEALRPVLEDPEKVVVNQNIKYDMQVLLRAGTRIPNIGVDPMVGDYLLDAGARSHKLETLATRYLNHKMIPIADLIGSGKKQKKMFEVDVIRAAEYASEDADIAWQLSGAIAEQLKRAGLWDLYWDLERPLIPVLVDMEFAGIRVNVDELKRQSDEAATRLDQLVDEIHQLAGHEFNIDSPKQLRVVLFDELKLPVVKKTKTGPSTDQEVLEKLADQHALPALIMEHRHLSKLKGTYLDALPLMVNPETGRIHGSFNQVVAATGRLSSSEPNLQNIPIRTPQGSRIRKAFVPGEPGWKLVCADYSQIELRMLAHFSEDPILNSAFRDGADIHTAVASEVFGVADSEVDSDMRRVAKAVNFGVIYGQSPYGLAAALGISQDEAFRFIDDYFKRYAGVDRYLERLLEEVAATGYARTILNRRRAISGIHATTGRNRNLPERTAINTVIQGSAADLIKRAMIDVHSHLVRAGHQARMLLQIHDELVFEVPGDEVDSLVALVRDGMQDALELNVPLVVDIKVGENWFDAEAIS